MTETMIAVAQQPTLIIHNARIYTVDASIPWAEAIAVTGHTITAIGSNQAIQRLAGPVTRLIDARGRLILPGLCDAHIHMHEFSINRTRPHLASARSRAEMLEMIAMYAQNMPANSWIVCQGWNESWWGERDFFTARDLDKVTQPGQPALVYRSDMHIAVANSAALAIANLTHDTPNPDGGIIDRDPEGAPTGVLRELAIALVKQHITPPTAEELIDIVQVGAKSLHRMGITAVHDQRIKDAGEGQTMLTVYQRLRRSGLLPLRVNCNIAAHQLSALAALGLQSGFGDDYLRLGHVKVFADGSLGSRTAWMIEPFEAQGTNEPANFGVNLTSPEQMASEFYQAQRLGFPISVHAIGDRANRVVLDIFEEIAPQLPPPPIPHRIEHVQTIQPQDLPRLAKLNITASVQPIHLTDDRELTDRFWGARAANTYAFESLHEGKIRLAFGSDAPVADPNPFLGIHAALARRRPGDPRPAWQPQECLAIEPILHAYTLGAAEAAGWQSTIGSLSPGKRADIIILDRNIFELAAKPSSTDEIALTEVLTTIFDGEIVYTHPGYEVER